MCCRNSLIIGPQLGLPLKIYSRLYIFPPKQEALLQTDALVCSSLQQLEGGVARSLGTYEEASEPCAEQGNHSLSHSHPPGCSATVGRDGTWKRGPASASSNPTRVDRVHQHRPYIIQASPTDPGEAHHPHLNLSTVDS